MRQASKSSRIPHYLVEHGVQFQLAKRQLETALGVGARVAAGLALEQKACPMRPNPGRGFCGRVSDYIVEQRGPSSAADFMCEA